MTHRLGVLGLLCLIAGCSSAPVKETAAEPTEQAAVRADAPFERINPLWVLPLRSTARYDLPPFERTKPILLGDSDILYVADQQGRVLAVHRRKGFILWETKMPSGVSGAFAYGRSKLVVGDRQGNLIALNARDGSEAWRFKIQGEWLSPPAFSANQVLAVSSAGDLYAFHESSGKETWHYARHSDQKMSILGIGGPSVYGSTDVFQGFGDGTLVALSVEKGRILWEKSLRGRERFYDIEMSPYVDEKRVIAATYDGRVESLNRLTGETLWVFPVGSYGGFLVEGDRLYFAGVNHQFYCVDLGSGQPVWTTAYEGGIASAPILVRGKLVFATSGDPSYVVDPQNGKILDRVPLGAGTLASAVGTSKDGAFYLLSNYGNLFAFEIIVKAMAGVVAGL